MKIKKVKKYRINYKRGYLFLNIIIILMSLVMIGSVFNEIAINSNNGKMPVLSEYHFQTNKHFSYTDNQKINYKFLSDRINFMNAVWSIGDIMMILSIILIIIMYYIMHYSKYKIKTEIKRKKK